MATLIAFQGSIAATGTPQNLPNQPFFKGVTLAAKSGNAAAIVVGNSSSVTATTGYILAAGQSVQIGDNGGNTDAIWVVGTSGDVFSVLGI